MQPTNLIAYLMLSLCLQKLEIYSKWYFQYWIDEIKTVEWSQLKVQKGNDNTEDL